jgi:hypothetical protein
MDLLLLHHLRNLVEALVLEAPGDALRHRLARLGRVRIDTVGNRTAGLIPIRNDADQAIVLADRQAADALVAHDPADLGEREVRGDHSAPGVMTSRANMILNPAVERPWRWRSGLV